MKLRGCSIYGPMNNFSDFTCYTELQKIISYSLNYLTLWLSESCPAPK
jgi:hypothetical protein